MNWTTLRRPSHAKKIIVLLKNIIFIRQIRKIHSHCIAEHAPPEL